MSRPRSPRPAMGAKQSSGARNHASTAPHTRQSTPNSPAESLRIPAGRFAEWLKQTRDAIRVNGSAEVDCRDCTGCCSSSLFILVRPEDTEALKAIPKSLLVPAFGMPPGHKLMGYDKHGSCPMLKNGQCSIYAQRPQTCRSFDCRVFSAAGIDAGDVKGRISQRLELWEFEYPSDEDRQAHTAVKAAAHFIQHNADVFPGGRIPAIPSQLAILALKVYELFLPGQEGIEVAVNGKRAELAQAIVDLSRQFDGSFSA